MSLWKKLGIRLGPSFWDLFVWERNGKRTKQATGHAKLAARSGKLE